MLRSFGETVISHLVDWIVVLVMFRVIFIPKTALGEYAFPWGFGFQKFVMAATSSFKARVAAGVQAQQAMLFLSATHCLSVGPR
jgi:hypothetical protein